MKLIGSSHLKNKNGSNNNSSRTSSPSRFEDPEFVNSSLLAAEIGDSGEKVPSLKVTPVKSDDVISSTSQDYRGLLQPKELITLSGNGNFGDQLVSEVNGDSCSIYPLATYEDETVDSDTTLRFEFDKEKEPLQFPFTRSSSRLVSSKWNDAEKWIMNRHFIQSGISKDIKMNDALDRTQSTNTGKVAPECTSLGTKSFVQLALTSCVDSCQESEDSTYRTTGDLRPSGAASVRSVSMRDTGTEMTPIPSQEPSRSTTPVGATTPFRSPNSSIPSTPHRDERLVTATEKSIGMVTRDLAETGKKELSEQEQKLKIRREIVALGVQLGKMNIAAWGSKIEKEISVSRNESIERSAYAKRAAAWEQAEKAKHAARFQQEETRIQAWENSQKAEVEAEMRNIEARIGQMRAEAQARMLKKITLAKQQSEKKRAAAEARINRDAVKTVDQAAYIRRTGRIPSPSSPICCGWW